MQVYVFKTEQDVDTYVGQQISTFINKSRSNTFTNGK